MPWPTQALAGLNPSYGWTLARLSIKSGHHILSRGRFGDGHVVKASSDGQPAAAHLQLSAKGGQLVHLGHDGGIRPAIMYVTMYRARGPWMRDGTASGGWAWGWGWRGGFNRRLRGEMGGWFGVNEGRARGWEEWTMPGRWWGCLVGNWRGMVVVCTPYSTYMSAGLAGGGGVG